MPMVEDAAEALGSFRSGIHCGLFGSIGTLSFNGNKLVTTGGEVLYSPTMIRRSRARHLSTTATAPSLGLTTMLLVTTVYPILMRLSVLPNWKI